LIEEKDPKTYVPAKRSRFHVQDEQPSKIRKTKNNKK